MSGRLIFRVEGVGTVSWNAPDATLEQLGASADIPLEAQRFTASRYGLEIHLPGRIATWVPAPAVQQGRQWSDFFDTIVGAAIFRPHPAMSVAFSGGLAIAIADMWGIDYASADAGPGRPRRVRRWDRDREEFYALVLQQRQKPGESLRDAIWTAATLQPAIFRRAFGGKLTNKRIEAAVQYVKRHNRDAALSASRMRNG